MDQKVVGNVVDEVFTKYDHNKNGLLETKQI